MPSDIPRFSGSLERQLLAQLLTEARRQAGLDVTEAAREWIQPVAHLQAMEAGDAIPDWHEIRRLLAVYGRDFLAFVTDFEGRLAALGEAPAAGEESPFLPGLR